MKGGGHMAKQHHVVPHKDGWAVKTDGAKKASIVADTKAEAEARGRVISQNQGTELIIHNLDGKIARCDSHGNDPCPPKDKE